jgi:hypothetical protein
MKQGYKLLEGEAYKRGGSANCGTAKMNRNNVELPPSSTLRKLKPSTILINGVRMNNFNFWKDILKEEKKSGTLTVEDDKRSARGWLG